MLWKKLNNGGCLRIPKMSDVVKNAPQPGVTLYNVAIPGWPEGGAWCSRWSAGEAAWSLQSLVFHNRVIDVEGCCTIFEEEGFQDLDDDECMHTLTFMNLLRHYAKGGFQHGEKK